MNKLCAWCWLLCSVSLSQGWNESVPEPILRPCIFSHSPNMPPDSSSLNPLNFFEFSLFNSLMIIPLNAKGGSVVYDPVILNLPSIASLGKKE